MDKKSFVESLNGDLRTEYQSIVQYISHIANGDRSRVLEHDR